MFVVSGSDFEQKAIMELPGDQGGVMSLARALQS
jgi:hypothetical protein